VTTLLLVRHGLTKLTGPVLAGWTPEVHLDERGQAQARELAVRIAAVPLSAIVSSPLERCRETADAIVAARVERLPAERSPDGPDGGRSADGADSGSGRSADGADGGGNEDTSAGKATTAAAVDKVEVDERFGEVRYGDWTGRPLKELAKEPLWRVVQAHPSAARFPGEEGESLAEAQHRALTAVRDWNTRLGPDATYLVCSHGDIIKAIVADALGLHLDQFQRIQADPASLTVIRYTELRPFVVRLNDTGGGVDTLLTPPDKGAGEDGGGDGDAGEAGDAPVGGGA
jgi:probable phosphomutase (TIGR03848 family)